jgi:hypothetical protein
MTARWSSSGSSGEPVGSINAIVEFEPDLCINPRQAPPPRGRLRAGAGRLHRRGPHPPPLGERWTSAAPSRLRSATPRPRSARQLVGNPSRSRPSRPPRRSRAPTRAAASHCGESRSLDSAIPICEPRRQLRSAAHTEWVMGLAHLRNSFFSFPFFVFSSFGFFSVLFFPFLFLFYFQIRKMFRSEKYSDFGNYSNLNFSKLKIVQI